MTGTDLLHVAGLALLVLLVPVILVAAALAIVRLDRGITRKRAAEFRAVAGAMGLEFRPQGIDGCWGDLSPPHVVPGCGALGKRDSGRHDGATANATITRVILRFREVRHSQ
jgi:hypothetical protein